MKYSRVKLFSTALLIFTATLDSYTQSREFIFPDGSWTEINENDSLVFRLRVKEDSDISYKYTLYGAQNINIRFDTLGNFEWFPSFDLVDRVEQTSSYHVIFEAVDSTGSKLRKEIEFVVNHVNRPPSIDELPTFYVRQYALNKMDINKLEIINDPDNDPFVFKAILANMPEGSSLSENGIFSWKPTRNQFRSLKKSPLLVNFIVQDQPSKAERIGTLRIMPTQLDLPPELVVVPDDSIYHINEDEVLNLNFYVSDPNGDDNIEYVDFISSDARIAKTFLKKNTSTQYEFNWTPGYNFVSENKTQDVTILFYAIDKANKRVEKQLKIRIKDTENIKKKDQRLYTRYEATLIQMMNLIDHLDENQNTLNSLLSKSKRGKKKRSILNASLGAVTGISPVILEGDPQSIVSGIGGTTVLTLGTLEATEVIGTSKNDILQKINSNIEIRNQLQTQGDQFARKYALKQTRREKSFLIDIDRHKTLLNNQKLLSLELDAAWENKHKPTSKNIIKTFPDFNNEGFEN